MPEIDGVLRDACFLPCSNGPQKRTASGKLYDDRKGRFSDGTEVRTSWVISGPDAEGIIRTRNSTYRIESYCEGASPEDFLK